MKTCTTCTTGKTTRSTDGKFIVYKCGARHTTCTVTPVIAEPEKAMTTTYKAPARRTYKAESELTASDDIFTTTSKSEEVNDNE